MNGPDPAKRHPLEGFPQVCFLQYAVANPLIEIGDYTYLPHQIASDPFPNSPVATHGPPGATVWCKG